MKYMYAFLLPLLAAVVSCASKPASLSYTGMPVTSSIPEEQPEPTDPFERAIWNVKMNTPLIKKYIEPKTTGPLEVSSSSVQDIVVKGELFFDGNEFLVIYDCAAASQAGESLFRIPFVLHNVTKSIF